MCEKTLQGILLEIAGLSAEQLSSATDPSLLACFRALRKVCMTAEGAQDHVFLASIFTCLDQLVASARLHHSSRGGTMASVAKVMEAVDRLLLFLKALEDRCAAALRLGIELLGPNSLGDCLQGLTKQWQESISLYLSPFLSEASDRALSVWGKTHCLLVVASSCFSMSCSAKKIVGVLQEDQAHWLCLSTLTPALEQLLPHTAQSLPLVVEELSEADVQCLVCSCDNKLVYVGACASA